jgi:hypothetical protein
VNGMEYLLITERDENVNMFLEDFPPLEKGLCYTIFVAPPMYTSFKCSELFCIWHDRLGH